MRASVLPDARLGKRARRFVWLSIDTEQPRNAAFLERFPIDTWPTFLVVDPRTEKPVVKWLGTATAAELDRLLADAEERERRDGPAARLARADAAYAEGRLPEAVAGYRAALAAGGPRWSRRPRAVESLVLALMQAQDREGCAATARAEAPRLPRGSAFANVVAGGLSCAVEAPRDAPWRAGALAALEPLGREALRAPGLLADDRSGLYDVLAEARGAEGDRDGVRRLAEAWWAFLVEEGRRARTAEERASLDSARVQAAILAGDPGRALPALRASARALPRDYNPLAREALVLRELGRLTDARAAAEQALARAYGPRKLKVYDLAASILERMGDRAGLERLVDEALAFAEELPPAQRNDKLAAALRARRAAARN
jgi:hypothetical protein